MKVPFCSLYESFLTFILGSLVLNKVFSGSLLLHNTLVNYFVFRNDE
jgi:hypothetical protein